MTNLRTPIHRSEVEFDPEEHAAVGRTLEKMAKADPKHQPALDAWRQTNAEIDQWEADAEARRAESQRPHRKAA